MQAIILAAGRGTRMRGLTDKTPKPLIKVAGKPVMEHVINLLSYHGVKEIGVNLFWLGDKIEEYFGDGKKWGVKIYYEREKELTGVGGGMKAAVRALKPKGPFIMVPGDTITNFDLTALYKSHLKYKDSIGTIGAYYRPRNSIHDCGIMLFDKKTKRIKRYIEKPKTKEEVITLWANAGIYVFDPKLLEYIPNKINDSKIVDLLRDVLPGLISCSKEKFYAYSFNRNRFYMLGINSEEELKMAERDIVEGKFIPLFRKTS